MNRPWLIQRAKFKNNTPSKIETVDQAIRFDYMGAAEFEWGALPQSLKRICKEIEKYKISETSVKNYYDEKVLYLLHHEDISSREYEKFIYEDIAGKLRLKEWTNLKRHITNKNDESFEKYLKDYNIWWDIDNDVWFTFGKEEIERIKNSIINVRDKM